LTGLAASAIISPVDWLWRSICVGAAGLAIAPAAAGAFSFTRTDYQVPPYALQTSVFPDSVALVDLRGTGKPDIVVLDRLAQSRVLDVFLNNGDGTFPAQPTQIATGCAAGNDPRNLIGGEFDGDTHPDLMLVCGISAEVFPGDGKGRFATPVTYSNVSTDAPMTLGQLDGNPDVVSKGGGNPSSTPVCFTPISQLGSMSVGPKCASTPIDSAALATAKLGNTNVALAYAHPNGFSQPQTLHIVSYSGGTFVESDRAVGAAAGDNAASIATADLNNDGFTDIVMGNVGASNSPGSLSVYLWDPVLGIPAGSMPVTYPSTVNVVRTAIADFDGDGRPDVAVAGQDPTSSAGELVIHAVNADGTLQPASPPTPLPDLSTGKIDMGQTAFAVGDLNGDGKPDLVSIYDNSSDRHGVSVLLNTTPPASPPPVTPPVTPPPVTTPPGFLTPHTTITSGPDGFTSSAPSFTFVSSLTGSTFECSFDGEPFTSCTTPTARYGLAYGPHTFRVRAISQFGVTDPTPAMRAFTLGAEVRPFSCTVDAAIDVFGLIGKGQCFITGTCPPLSQCGIANGSIDLANVQRTQGWVNLDACSGSAAPSSCGQGGSRGTFSDTCQINTPVVFTPCPSTGPNYSIDFQPPVARFALACTVFQTSRANPTGQITCTVGLRIIPAKPFVLIGQIGTTPAVFVPGAGSVVVSALTSVVHAQAAARRRVTSSPFAPLRVSAHGAGFVALPLKLSRQATATLLRKRRLTLRLRLRFTPTVGAGIVRTQTVALRTRPCLAPAPTANELLKRGAHKPKPQTCKPRL
jgi:hypothetical protein